MKLSSQPNASIPAAMRSSNTSHRGRGGRGGCHINTYGRGGPFKTNGYTTGYEALRIRGGAPADIDIADHHNSE
jgi:hypothetical protein